MATKIIWCLLAATALIHRGKVLQNFTFRFYFRHYGMFTRVYGVLKYYSRLLSKQMEGHIIAVQILLLLDYACISVGGIRVVHIKIGTMWKNLGTWSNVAFPKICKYMYAYFTHDTCTTLFHPSVIIDLHRCYLRYFSRCCTMLQMHLHGSINRAAVRFEIV